MESNVQNPLHQRRRCVGCWVKSAEAVEFFRDNGSAYKLRRFAELLHRLGIEYIRTRSYTPQTSGKAERVIQTLLR